MKSEGRKSALIRGICILTLAGLVVIVFSLSGCEVGNSRGGGGGSHRSSRSYVGHANDADINNFIKVYHFAKGTRLDDCKTCHKGGTVVDDKSHQVLENPCNYCHLIQHPPTNWTNLPTSTEDTLNPYGADYEAAGRDQKALKNIENDDSDGDGYTNIAEIEDLRLPGDTLSQPGLPLCNEITVSMHDLKHMPSHTQFGLGNTSKQQFDFYATYTGVKIRDLLIAEGIDLTGATSIDILAPDSFARTFTVAQITDQFPAHRFFSGFDVATLGTTCAFVEYPANTYGYAYGETIVGEQWHILAWAREGLPLEPSYLDPVTGKINGEGPLRNVVPPGSVDPNMNTPDRGQNADTSGCTMPEWNYVSGKDHNATNYVKGAVIIRINPMPTGCEQFDLQNGGWALIDSESILIYGHGVPTP